MRMATAMLLNALPRGARIGPIATLVSGMRRNTRLDADRPFRRMRDRPGGERKQRQRTDQKDEKTIHVAAPYTGLREIRHQ